MSSLGIKLLVGAGLLAGLLFGWNWYIDGVRQEADQGGYARAEAEHRQRENEALKQALADKARLEKELQGVSDEARKKLDAARADAVAAADAGQRLRDQLAAFRRGAQCPRAPAGGSPPADAREAVYSNVQRLADEAAESLARYADEARIAGLACQRAYESLK